MFLLVYYAVVCNDACMSPCLFACFECVCVCVCVCLYVYVGLFCKMRIELSY